MNIKYIIAALFLALMIPAPKSAAQYLSKMYDYDTTDDFGDNIFVLPDSTFFILDGALDFSTSRSDALWMHVSKNGEIVISKNGLFSKSTFDYAIGGYGKSLMLGNGKILIPLTTYYYSGKVACNSGMLIIDSNCRISLQKTFTDTNRYYEETYYCTFLSLGGYMLAGDHFADTSINSSFSALVIRTDSAGNLLWRKTYQKYSGFSCSVSSIDMLPDGNILLGAYEQVLSPPVHFDYYLISRPWFLVLDTAGNVLKDSFWPVGAMGGGNIYHDINGGYFHWGELDTLITGFPTDDSNFTDYITHLDSNFNVTWMTRFQYTADRGHRYVQKVFQLHDSTYLAVGNTLDTKIIDSVYYYHSRGWASKLSRTGKVIWDQEYINDINEDSYLVDGKEKADGSIVMVGEARNDTLPAWHAQDVWLVEVDSNGCIVPGGCSNGLSTAVPQTPKPQSTFSVYPNPTTGSLTVNAPGKGSLYLYDLQGQQVQVYSIVTGHNHITLPSGTAAGVYIGRYVNEEDGSQAVTRIIYQP